MDQVTAHDEIFAAAARLPPILDQKFPAAASVFRPENMLREARRQKNVTGGMAIPTICILDPDGDLVAKLQQNGRARLCEAWVCYHTRMYEFEEAGQVFGIIGGAVGASFSVLLAEQAFASGCEVLISLSSAGQIFAPRPPPYFILIERALRDEGTSYHYLAPARYAEADAALTSVVAAALREAGQNIQVGATWTTDAPFRETEAAIAAARAEQIYGVEMEAAALYAFARAQNRKVICFAQITNQLGQIDGDFEKGEANGAHDALALIAIAGRVALAA